MSFIISRSPDELAGAKAALVHGHRADAGSAMSDSGTKQLVSDRRRDGIRPSVLIAWTITATLVTASVWLGQLHLQNQAEKNVLQDQLKLAELEVKGRRQQLEAERILTTRQLADATDQVTKLTKELAQTGETISDSNRALAETSRQLETTKAELLACQNRLDEVSQKLAAANSEVSALRERMRGP